MSLEIGHEKRLQNVDSFLSSINIRYDAIHAERIAHFQPTAKSVPLVKALLGQEGERAFFINAPYGSGKSLTATYLLHLIENRRDSSDALRKIQKRLKPVNPELGRFAANRLRQEEQSGIVITLEGYAQSLGQSIKDAVLEAMDRLKLNRQSRPIRRMKCNDITDVIEILSVLKEKAIRFNYDRIVILWDEFGRHLESLVVDGRPAALSEIQILAEFVSRSKDTPMTLGLLLHQNLFHYAGNVPHSVRSEWKKVEGRFCTIQYIDDSDEIYRLIADVVSALSNEDRPTEPDVSNLTNQCKKLGLFTNFKRAELKKLLMRAYPLEPAALFLLPRLSGRVAQNERTLFSFLNSVDLSTPVGGEILYDYFSPTMQSDTAVGGTYRQWLETQSALTKAEDEDESRALKLACLLGLGASGERSRAMRDLLLFALQGYVARNGQEAVVNRLVERKLLIHRRHSDEVSIWHGTDADLRGKLEEEKLRQINQFDLLDFLSKEARPPTWRSLEYNDDFGVLRYFKGEYHSLETLNAYLTYKVPIESIPVGCDGKMLFVVAGDTQELAEAEAIIHERLENSRIVAVLPREPLPLFEAALEVWCLLGMQVDADLVGSDPLIGPELQQMADDARGHLQKQIDRLVRPGPKGPRWFYQGLELEAKSPQELRRKLSEIMRKVYSHTPKIKNEMIVRNKISGVVVNARKKLLFGILERIGEENLGIEGNFPDASMFRTVLFHTGLYRKENGRWGFAPPEDIEDEGLRAVWEQIRDFFTLPQESPKNPRKLFEDLMEPPYGLRAGLLPIFFAAGLKAFPSSFSLTRNGVYVSDILPSVIEQLCREPDLYRVIILELGSKKLKYLRNLHKCFSSFSDYESKTTDLIRKCFDSIENWKAELPPAAMTAKRISKQTQRFRNVIFGESDPVKLLFDGLPSALGCSIDSRRLFNIVSQCIDELMGLVSVYKDHAASSIKQAVELNIRAEDREVVQIASEWASCFSEKFAETLTDDVARAVLFYMSKEYESDELLLEALSLLLTGKSLDRWDDTKITMFDRGIKDVVRRVEEEALMSYANSPKYRLGKSALLQIIKGRMYKLFVQLNNIAGTEKAEAILSSFTTDSS